MVAAPPEWEEPCILVAEEVAAGKVAKAVTGGETRSESVRAALAEVPETATVVARSRRRASARHRRDDRARDHSPRRRLGRRSSGPADPDTVKRVDGEAVAETLDRAGLVTAQTPQAFDANALRDAFSTLQHSVTKSTDCASLVEANGGRVRAVEGDPRLLKVTTPADLELVASWL